MTKPRRKKSPPCYVYMLASIKAGKPSSYVGWTLDVARRLAQHNAGIGAKATRGGSWTVIHVEACKTRRAAMSREWHLKRDRKLRKALMSAAPPARAARPKMLP